MNMTYLVDIDLDHLTGECLSAFSTLKLLSFPYCLLWKEVTACSPHLRSRELYMLSTGWSIYMYHLEFFCIEYLSLLPHLFNRSFVYISGDSWMFILNFEESRSNYHSILLLNFTPTFSHVWIHPSPSSISLAPGFKSAIEPGFLSLKNNTENQDLDVACACCYSGIFAWVFSVSAKGEDMCMCSKPCI